MTLEQYFKEAAASGFLYEFRVVPTVIEGRPTKFYIHPLGKNGRTMDFEVDGNQLKTVAVVGS